MMTSNNALVPDPDKQDDLASQFWQWPILHVGLRMCGWDDSIVKYFLLGNPLVYWFSTASLGLVAVMVAWYLVRWQRGYGDLTEADIDQIHYSALYPILGWFLHYLPFVAMARVTYVHHYYPALYFAILNLGFLTDWLLRNKNKLCAIRHLRCPVCHNHWPLHPVHANLLGNGRSKPSIQLLEVVRQLESNGLNKGPKTGTRAEIREMRRRGIDRCFGCFHKQRRMNTFPSRVLSNETTFHLSERLGKIWAGGESYEREWRLGTSESTPNPVYEYHSVGYDPLEWNVLQERRPGDSRVCLLIT